MFVFQALQFGAQALDLELRLFLVEVIAYVDVVGCRAFKRRRVVGELNRGSKVRVRLDVERYVGVHAERLGLRLEAQVVNHRLHHEFFLTGSQFRIVDGILGHQWVVGHQP
jgi:hypothetical protein